jgi:hypothetical protein
MVKAVMRVLLISKEHNGMHLSTITSEMTSQTLKATHFTAPN